jgi:hypothetical protein
MAFYQVPQGHAAAFSQLHDRNDPSAQAYARQALARNGIQVPRGADAAAMWRQFSQMRAGAMHTAQAVGPDPYDAGIRPGVPHDPYGESEQPGIYEASPISGPTLGPREIAGRAPEGGFLSGLARGMDSSMDWRTRIQQMAAALSPANTLHRVQNMSAQFQHQGGGSAEAAFARLQHVDQVHRHVAGLARTMTARRPSKAIPIRRTRDPQAY